jgi:hypothetical protein
MRVVYRPSFTHDAWLLQWYARLIADGELAELLSVRARPLAAFMHNFQAPTVLWLEVEPDWGPRVVQGAMWFAPFLDGASVGLYLAPEWRHTRPSVVFVTETMSAALERWPVLVAWTHDPRRVRTYRRFGLVLSGSVPRAREGGTIWLLTLTAAQHATRVARMRRDHHEQPVAAGR